MATCGSFAGASGTRWVSPSPPSRSRGHELLLRMAQSGDPDLVWVVRENLKKARLRRIPEMTAKVAPQWGMPDPRTCAAPHRVWDHGVVGQKGLRRWTGPRRPETSPPLGPGAPAAGDQLPLRPAPGVPAFDAPMSDPTIDGRSGRVPASCVFWMHARIAVSQPSPPITAIAASVVSPMASPPPRTSSTRTTSPRCSTWDGSRWRRSPRYRR